MLELDLFAESSFKSSLYCKYVYRVAREGFEPPMGPIGADRVIVCPRQPLEYLALNEISSKVLFD